MAVCGLSLAAASGGGCSLVALRELLIAMASLGGAWAPGHMGLAASVHVGSSWTRNRTHVPRTGRRILNH